MREIIKDHLDRSMSYEEYRTLVSDLLADNKTTGVNQTEDYIHYTKLSSYRMRRLDKTLKFSDEDISLFNDIDRELILFTITEGWCGDASQIVPVIEKITANNENISTRYILRDDNPELMDLFLTNGGRSIPIIIVIDKKIGEYLTHWGPRPSFMQNWVMSRKKDPNASPYIEFIVEAQKWYNDDKGKSIVTEFGEELMKVVKAIES